jgi:hypothetical protein
MSQSVLALLTGALAAVLFVVGGTSIARAASVLFGSDFRAWDSYIDRDLLLTGSVIVGPIFALALMPNPGALRPDHEVPLFWRVVATWIIAPILVIGVTIFIVTAIIVLIAGGPERIGASVWVAVWPCVAIILWMLVWPFRNRRRTHIRIFVRRLPIVQIAPALAAGASLYVMITEYGLTFLSHALRLLCLWFVIFVVFTWQNSDRRRMAILPLSFGILLFAYSLGPSSVREIGARHQMARLEHFLSQAGVIDGHPLAANAVQPSAQLRTQIRESLIVLWTLGRLDRTARFLAEEK